MNDLVGVMTLVVILARDMKGHTLVGVKTLVVILATRHEMRHPPRNSKSLA